jgi:ribosome-associated protein
MDFMVVATAKAETHVKAISEYLLDEMKKDGNPAFAEEGVRSGTWACMDFGETIVHIMRDKERSFYNLEAIWGGAEKLSYNDANE